MSCWLTDPDLFLYAKGIGSDDVHLWRCKKPVSSSSSSSLVMPMKSDDFDYVSNVENHLELIADLFDWDETDYKRLVKYIFERRLLVNSQGFVIAELLHKVVDQDGNKMIDDANEEVPAIYIRSLDVLALKPYIPELRERPIPLRTVQVLEDVDGKVAVMEKDFNVTELTARIDYLEAENHTLDTNVTELTARVANLEANLTKLTADMVTQTNELATVQQELRPARNGKEVWMNYLTNNNQWVGFESLIQDATVYDNVIVVKPQGTFTADDGTTNVQARYWYQIQLSRADSGVANIDFKAVCLEDLTPYKENARFSPQPWAWAIKCKGKTYVIRKVG